MLLKHLFILCPQAPELPVHDLNSLWKFSPPFLLFLLLLSLPYCSSPQKSVFNLITIPQWKLSPGCLKNSSQICCSFSPCWTIRSWCALARTDQISLPQNSPSNYQEEQGLELRLPSNILISFPDNSSCRKSRKRKCRALKQVFFTKVELEIPSGCELHGSVHLL